MGRKEQAPRLLSRRVGVDMTGDTPMNARPTTSWNLRFLVLTGFLALALRLTCALVLPPEQTWSDSGTYDLNAWNLAQGKGYSHKTAPSRLPPPGSSHLHGSWQRSESCHLGTVCCRTVDSAAHRVAGQTYVW